MQNVCCALKEFAAIICVYSGQDLALISDSGTVL